VSVRGVARALVVLSLAAVVAAAAALPARGDGDPASDTLLYSDLFIPYTQQIDDAATKGLQAVLTDARKKGKPMRVAIIGSPYDLGSVGGLWGQPQQYATFLGQEIGIGLRDKSTLMVVMPAGFGLYAGQRKTTDAQLSRLKGIVPGKTGNDLTKAGVAAVERLTGAHGSAGGGSPWHERLIILLAVVIGLALMGGLSLLTARARAARARGQQT
jgi:hypothetical protein